MASLQPLGRSWAKPAGSPNSGKTGAALVAGVALAAVVALLLGLMTLPNGFVIDDHYLIESNTALRELATVPGFFMSAWGNDGGGAARTQINAAYYRPLSSALQALEVALFSRRGAAGLTLVPAGFHLVSALLYALATLAVTLLGRRLAALSGEPPAGAARLGLITGLLFAVHPIHTEPLAAATYQTTLLSGWLALLALQVAAGGLAPAQKKAPWGALGGTALLSLAATLAKEEAAALPVLVLLLGVLSPRHRRRALLLALASGVGVGLMLLLRSAVVKGAGITYFTGAPPWATALTMSRVLVLYTQLLLLPLSLCPFYDWFIVPIEVTLTPMVALGAVVLAALLLLSRRAARSQPLVALGLLWFLAALLPVSHLLPMLNVAGERFLYLPSVGACLAAAVGLCGLFARCDARRPLLRRGATAALCALLLLLGLRSALRLREWRDDITLNLATARDFPETPLPHYNLYKIYREAGDWPRARAALREAARRGPELPHFQRELEELEQARPWAR